MSFIDIAFMSLTGRYWRTSSTVATIAPAPGVGFPPGTNVT
jgi:hypothetical protein